MEVGEGNGVQRVQEEHKEQDDDPCDDGKASTAEWRSKEKL
jgi:hypothetical protein